MIDITEFRGPYAFLSNFWLCPVRYVGDDYPSVEHAYQAAKFQDDVLRDKIARAPTPGAAKKQARLWAIQTAHWDIWRLDVMRDLLHEKFDPLNDEADMLLATGKAGIVEVNRWGDTFWGVCKGVGENHLGKMLMEIRGDLGGTGIVETLEDL